MQTKKIQLNSHNILVKAHCPEGSDLCTGWCPECRARLHCETYIEDFWVEVEKDGGPWWELPQYQQVERRILLPVSAGQGRRLQARCSF